MKVNFSTLLLVPVLMFGSAIHSQPANADAQAQAIRLFDRLAGVPIRLEDPRLAQMVAAINRGDLKAAAAVATADDSFYNITLKHFATPLSNREEDYQRPLNDFVATVIGAVRDDLDARTLLTGSYVYRGDAAAASGPFKYMNVELTLQSDQALLIGNSHYAALETSRANLKTHLVSAPQRGYAGAPFTTAKDPVTMLDVTTLIPPITLPDTAGLMTTRQWFEEHLDDGTNRRPVQYAFQVFLCKKNTETRDTSVPDIRVRQDVDRMPGGVAATYQTSCRGCHGSMDALAGAYGFFDNERNGNFVSYTAGVVKGNKYNRNSSVFKNGYRTIDDSWINHYTQNQNAALGWAPGSATSGKGVRGVGTILSNTQAFSSCMAHRTFKEVCRRDPRTEEESAVQTLADKFVSGGYKLRGLFEDAAIQKTCLGN